MQGLGTRCRPGRQEGAMDSLKIIVEKHPDGYVAYPVGIRDVIVG